MLSCNVKNTCTLFVLLKVDTVSFNISTALLCFTDFEDRG